ncbi:MAG: ferritin family protein [Deltaproteobacteria bacterium]|nr:ferritin family protein [Deltaproteobacteria bacterium]MBI3755846.1 ferritin family protein [Deltaproteobacteria bacterium]
MKEKVIEKVIENLKTAVRTEMEGYSFYIAASNAIKDEHGQNVFRHLAKEELEHITVLSAINRSFNVGGGWLSYNDAVAQGVPNKGGAPIFLEENELTKRLKQNPTEIGAVTIAVEVEEKAVHFYSGLLKAASEPDEKTVITKILDMERNHLKLLRWEHGSIVRTGFWADFMEFSVEKELE